MYFQDLNEHTSTLVSLVGLFAGVSAFLLWRLLTRMEKKLDELHQLCCDCRQELGERFLSRYEHDGEHQDLWLAVNHHAHDLRGRVVR